MFEIVTLVGMATVVGGAIFVRFVMPAVQSRGALRAWAASEDGEVVGSRARLKARRDIEAFNDQHNRAGTGWAARASGLGISGATTLWIERRKERNVATGFTSDDTDFDRSFFVGGDGGRDLDGVVHLAGFRTAVRELFARVDPVAVELDVDGNLIVRTGRLQADPDKTRALLEGTGAFADALTSLAHEVKQRARSLAAAGESASIGGESGAPMPVPAQRG